MTNSSSAPVSTPLNQFAATLHTELAKENKTFVFSPISLHLALAMCLTGASGANYEEMNQVLFGGAYGNDRQTSLTPILAEAKSLIQSYLAAGETTKLKIANGLFTNPSFTFSINYKTLLYSNFSAKIQNQLSAEVINKFVEEATENIIKNLIAPSTITPYTASVLVNAIYFKGTWQHPFDKEFTNENGEFNKFDKTVTTVPMMNSSLKAEDVYYGQHDWNDNKFRSLSLPYKGKTFSMVFIRPDENSEEAFGKLSHELFSGKRQLLVDIKKEQQNNVKVQNIRIPRFKLESTHTLNKQLQNAGLKKAFEVGGFQNMTDQENEMKVDLVIQKAFMEVNEEGTVAAAATAVRVFAGCAIRKPVEIREFILDRPFLCLLQHEPTGTIAFAAQVTTL